MSSKKNMKGYGILFFLGSLLGAIAALFVSTDKQGKIKKPVGAKVKYLKDFAHDIAEKERVTEIFGTFSTEGKALYRSARKQLVDELSELSEALKDIDKTKYTAVVNNVIARLKKEGGASAKELVSIKKYLVEDFSKLKSSSKKA